jgi:hypothetical protein
MTRRAAATRDPKAFRDHWKRLAERALAHAAAPASVTEGDVEDVVNVTVRAEAEWTRLALDPRGIVCRELAQIHRDFVRQRGPSGRARLAPLLSCVAELVLALHAETDPGAEAHPAPPARLRYRADLEG